MPRCSWCDKPHPSLLPVEGDRLCPTCVDAYLDEAAKELHIIEDGRPTVYRRGYVTPRAWAYR